MDGSLLATLMPRMASGGCGGRVGVGCGVGLGGWVGVAACVGGGTGAALVTTGVAAMGEFRMAVGVMGLSAKTVTCGVGRAAAGAVVSVAASSLLHAARATSATHKTGIRLLCQFLCI